MIDWTTVIGDLLTAIITAVLPVLSYYIVRVLRYQADRILERKEAEAFEDTLRNSVDLIISAVDSTTQTYVDSLKASGSFTEENQREAFRLTKETISSLLTDGAREVLQTAYKDIDAWIDMQIEASINNRK